MNGLQSTLLTLRAEMLTLVLAEEAIMLTVAVITQTAGPCAMLRSASASFLLGVHFICNLKAVGKTKKYKVIE